MTMISIRNIFKDYLGVSVIERVNLEVERGTFCTIVGASGCGKSTFLRIVLGQERASRGDILIDDKALPEEPTPDRGIVFQRYSVFPHLTVLQNLVLAADFDGSALFARTFGAERRAAREKADGLLERIGLAHARDRYPSQLSGGMQQRLAIAQSLMKNPQILLLDEPFGALDPGVRLDMHDLLIDLWKQHNMTIFMVTHDIAEAFKLGTRLIVFDKVRHDPDFPNAYGATITYDLKLKDGSTSDAARTAEFLANETLTTGRATNVHQTDSA
ncbi:MAG TPA: ABC transporter ATP-binding protein [Hyphomicrobiales bacterium]|nr:ABC transporter ATP-binding protein [Hyphomicrobiales bacterium]